MSENRRDLESLLDHIGIGLSGSDHTTLMELMSFTLHCLGGIRMLVNRREKLHHAALAAEEIHDPDEIDKTIRQLFASSVKTLLEPISTARVIDDLDPSRHLIESFPDRDKLGNDQWLMLHWAVLDYNGGSSNTAKTSTSSINNVETGVPRNRNLNCNCNSYRNLPSDICAPDSVSALDADVAPGGAAASTDGSEVSPARLDSATTTGLGLVPLPPPPSFMRPRRGRLNSCDCFVDARVNVIEKIAQAHPDVIDELDRERRSVLHYASRLNSVNLVQCLLKIAKDHDSSGLDWANSNGARPLHNVARFSKSVDVAEFVRKSLPGVISMGNNNGTLPLHWAAAKNTNTNVINSLFRAYPEAINMPDNEGSLPLHSAGQNKYFHIVKVIYDAFPGAISIPDSEGGVPLHHACCFNSNLEVVKFMYEAYPEGLSLAQGNGIMPIHLAASQNASADVMRFVLLKCPASAFAVDGHGWLPLHCLIDNDPLDMTASRIESLRLLLRANPGAVLHRNRDGRSALDHARFRHHSEYVIRAMLLACPEADPVELARLNWSSHRRHALLTFLSLSRAAEPARESYASRELGVYVLLSQGAFSASGLSVVSSVLRHIINYL